MSRRAAGCSLLLPRPRASVKKLMRATNTTLAAAKVSDATPCLPSEERSKALMMRVEGLARDRSVAVSFLQTFFPFLHFTSSEQVLQDVINPAEGAPERQGDEDSDAVSEALLLVDAAAEMEQRSRQCRQDDDREEDHERGREQRQSHARLHHQEYRL